MGRISVRILVRCLRTFPLAGSRFAQMGAIQGKVLARTGSRFRTRSSRLSQRYQSNYQTKTNRRGEYFHAGLPAGAPRDTPSPSKLGAKT